MGLESATFVQDLVATNPPSSDDVAQGDDHIRLLKTALKTTFPNADKAFYFPDFASKTIDFSVASTDLNKTFLVDTSGGSVTATLPSLTSSDDGWICHFIKSTTDTNPLFVAPASGTLTSGEVTSLAKCRRAIPGHRSTAIWTGTAWYVTRVPGSPVGSTLNFVGSTAPVGYELMYGQTLSDAANSYPEYYSVNGSSGVVGDDRGRAEFGKDNMGGSTAGRITSALSGLVGTTLGAAGGLQSKALAATHFPTSLVIAAKIATITLKKYSAVALAAGGSQVYTPDAGDGTSSENVDSHTHPSVDGAANTQFPTLPPGIIRNRLLVVE